MKYIIDIDALKECLDLLPTSFSDIGCVELRDVIKMIDRFPKEKYGNECVDMLEKLASLNEENKTKENLNYKEKAICSYCNSLIEFDASDISQTMDYDHVMHLEIWKSSVKCPVCNRYTKAREDLAFEA